MPEEELGDRGGPREPHIRTGRNLFCPRSRRSRERRAGPFPAPLTQRHSTPPGAGGNGRARELLEGRWPRAPDVECWQKGRRRPRTRPCSPPSVQQSAGVRPGRARRAARVGWGGDTGGAPRTPGALAGVAQRRTRTPLPSVTRSPAQDGRVPSADRVHVGRRARSRPAPSSAALAAHGRRRRAPEAGGDRLQPV